MKKKVISIIVLLLLINVLTACSSAELEELKFIHSETEKEYEQIQIDYTSLLEKHEELKEEKNKLEKEYKELKEKAEPFLKLTEDEKAAETARAEAERLSEEKKLQEMKEQEEKEKKAEKERKEKAKQEEEKKGYNTGITYKQLARTPKKYKGKKVKFKGKVLQVMEEDDLNSARVATKNGYDDVVYIAYNPDLLSVRMLEDDVITFYGTYVDVYTYTTVMKSSVTIPLVSVEKIDIHD